MRITTRISKLIAPLLTLAAMIIVTSPAFATSKTGNFCIKNTTQYWVMFSTANIDNYDWEARRPDHNFNNIWIGNGQTYCATWDANLEVFNDGAGGANWNFIINVAYNTPGIPSLPPSDTGQRYWDVRMSTLPPGSNQSGGVGINGYTYFYVNQPTPNLVRTNCVPGSYTHSADYITGPYCSQYEFRRP